MCILSVNGDQLMLNLIGMKIPRNAERPGSTL